jgi:ligand-binding SRPBCC domain-containing protein
MEIGGWVSQNWFNLFSAIGIIAGLCFTAFSLRSETKTRRIANLLSITANHREVWKEFLNNPNLARICDTTANLTKQPITDTERVFATLVILHMNSVYYAMNDQLVVEYEGLRRDIDGFISRPIPKAVWEKIKPFQNDDFVAFVESCRNWK